MSSVSPERSRLLGVYLRGMAMGAADVVPGVSGGTIAFITGIYDRLLAAIRSFRPGLLLQWRRLGWQGIWRAVDGAFLLVLLAGIVTSIVSLARLITWALENQRLLVMAFFFGLIIASCLYLARQLRPLRFSTLAVFVIGAALALMIAWLRPGELPATLPWLFGGGAIAICAMILPGVSGSFILLMLGLYQPVLAAVRDFDLLKLLVFASGCGVGLLSFSHFLGWLLTHWRQPTMSMLTGFLAGSLALVWPWQIRNDGLLSNLRPEQYQLATGESAQLLPALGLMLLGCGLVLGLDTWAGVRARRLAAEKMS